MDGAAPMRRNCCCRTSSSPPTPHVALVPHRRVHGCNNSKKIMAVRIIKHTMEIIHLLTSIQITIDAIIHRAVDKDVRGGRPHRAPKN